MKCAIDREHPLEHFEEAFDLDIGARVEPWVRLCTATEPSFDRSIDSGFDSLGYQGPIGRCRLLQKATLECA